MVTSVKLTPEAVSILKSGRQIAAELPASEEDRRRWIAVYPYVSGVPGGAPYRGDGAPTFDIHLFEISKASIVAGYDVAGELMNQVRVTVEPSHSLASAVRDLEARLVAMGIDPAVLGKPDDEFPL